MINTERRILSELLWRGRALPFSIVCQSVIATKIVFVLVSKCVHQTVECICWKVWKYWWRGLVLPVPDEVALSCWPICYTDGREIGGGCCDVYIILHYSRIPTELPFQSYSGTQHTMGGLKRIFKTHLQVSKVELSWLIPTLPHPRKIICHVMFNILWDSSKTDFAIDPRIDPFKFLCQGTFAMFL